jgi:hypothetical protein
VQGYVEAHTLVASDIAKLNSHNDRGTTGYWSGRIAAVLDAR